MRHTLFIAALAGVSLAGEGSAQEQPAIHPGARVRITAPLLHLNRHVGTVDRLIPDTVVVDTIRVPTQSLVRLEVRSGTKSWALEGLAFGLLFGASMGALVGYGECRGEPDLGLCVYMGATMLGIVGLVVGGLVGTFVHTDRWREVPLEGLRIGAILERRGPIGIGVSFSM